MLEDVAKNFLFPKFNTPRPGTLREVLANDITPGDNISLNGPVMIKLKAIGLSIMLRTVMEVDQDYTVFNYGPPSPQKDIKSQGRKIATQSGMKTSPKFVLPENNKEKIVKEPPQYEFIMDNLETLLAATVDNTRGNASGSIVGRFIKLRA